MRNDDHSRSPTILWLVVLGTPLGLAGWVGLWWLVGLAIEYLRRRYG